MTLAVQHVREEYLKWPLPIKVKRITMKRYTSVHFTIRKCHCLLSSKRMWPSQGTYSFPFGNF